MLRVSAAAELTRAKVLSVSIWWKCSRAGRRIHLRWLLCPWAVAGSGRASRRHTEPDNSDPAPLVWRAAEGPESTDGERAGRRPRAHRAARNNRGAISSPARQGSQTKTSGTGRCYDPRLGWQGTQSCNPQGIRNVGGTTRPGHSQGRPDKRNDVLGGPAQAS